MSSAQFNEAIGICDAIDAALNKLDALEKDPLTHGERIALLERREAWRRRLPAGEHVLLAELAYAPVAEIGGRLAHVLADRLRIYRRDAKRRIEEAFELAPRRAMTGEPLAPKLECTAAGQRAGRIGGRARGDHPRLSRPAALLGRGSGPGAGRAEVGPDRRGVSPR